MSNIFELPRDADGFLDMEAFPDADLEPTDAAHLDDALASSGEPTLDNDTWQSLVEQAVDPDAPPVDDALVGSDDPDPVAYEAENPFDGVDDNPNDSAASANTDEVDADPAAAEASDDDVTDPAELDLFADNSDLIADEDSLAGFEGDDLPPAADDLDGLDALETHLHDDDL